MHVNSLQPKVKETCETSSWLCPIFGAAAVKPFVFSSRKSWMCEHCTYVNNPGVSVCAMCCRTSTNSTIGEEEARIRSKKKEEEKRERASNSKRGGGEGRNKSRQSSRFVPLFH